MNKKRKVVFAGGCFQAEFSMRSSLVANGIECHYLYEIPTPSYLMHNPIVCNYKQDGIITFVNKLEPAIIDIQPDVIIHRLYKNDCVMHHNAYGIAKSLGIPYGKFLMETDINDRGDMDNRFGNCDFVMYAHDTDAIKKLLKEGGGSKNTYFYPYGVGVNEYSDKTQRNKDVVAFGYPRFGIPETKERESNFEIVINGVRKINSKLNVFNSPSSSWNETRFINDVILNDFFYLEQEHEVMNKFKIAINFESVHTMEGAYSHKMFQTMGRGIPTLTFRKKCIEEMFGFSGENLIYFETSDEVAYWLYFLLKNHKFREEISERCEKYVHQKYDWYNRFNKIMIKQGIWK